jgi:hypothetical protein
VTAALRWTKRLLLLAVAIFLALLASAYARRHPQDVPWSPLDLSQPVGLFTAAKVAGLKGPACKALLRRAGIGFRGLPGRREGPDCGYDDAVRLTGGAATIGYRPTGLGTSCRVAAALALWEWNVVQPAALRHFGRHVVSIDTFGSYSCRRIYGRRTGQWSEHARANAVDVAAFRLEDGRRVSVAGDWRGDSTKARFLHEVRDGACRVFATTLSPDYNAAHRDHLHLDEAGRARMGWRACR